MNTMRIAALSACLMGGLAGSAALAADTVKEDARELAGYVRTGDTESCIQASRIDHARILNSHQILFEMKGGPDYLNEPDCRLNKSLALGYEVTAGQLCDTTIVKLLDVGSPVANRGTCAMSPFIKLEKKTADAR